ncbi:nuclease [Methylomonas koyamae]|uniref:Nuclease n=2 Tax=Methylococcaceae TaxID=403 RepID=A0A177NYZ1_9GAMM|nr:nuclease [Methylomonas koyamae]
MAKRWELCGLGMLLVSVAQGGDVYRWTDAQGRRHYSDRGTESAEVLSVDPGVALVEVERVYDGDTILLANGEKIRFLGVNTPEVAGRNKSAEAGGEQAKAWLRAKLERRKVYLEGDVEKQDKYQRRLAYVFTESREFVNLELVRAGLAMVNIFPPNLKYVDSLLAAQRDAERAGLGIWGRSEYAAQPYASLNAENYHGWKRLTGRISGIKRTAKYSYLQFSDGVAVAVENRYASLFPPLASYVGRQVEARGWVRRSKDKFALQARHGGDILLGD